MKHTKLLLIIPGSIFLASSLLADTKVPKYGFVNFEAAIAQEQEAQKFIRELEAEEIKIGESEQKARVDIEKKMKNYKDTVASLSEKAKAEKEMQISAEIGELQQKFQQQRSELGQKRQDRLRVLEDKNRLLVNSLSENGGYDMVFTSQALVFVSEPLKKNDLTQSLIAAYNKAYPIKADAAKPAVKSAPKK